MKHSDIEWDYRFHAGSSGTTDRIKEFQREFGDLYKLPINQRVISKFYSFRRLVYLWNAFMLKMNRTVPDSLENLKRLKEFKVKNGGDPGQGRFLLRVDDYPRFDIGIERYMEFHNIAKEFNVSYLLGVTPYLSEKPFEPSKSLPDGLTDDEVDTLLRLKKDKVEFGLHGITHRTLYKRYHTETVGLPGGELARMIRESISYLNDLNIRTEFYIPPFNTFDMNNFQSVKEMFRGITGGPESVPLFGNRLCPTSIDGTLFIPVFHPFYGKSIELVNTLRSIDIESIGSRLIPLVVHWSWEVGSDFKHFRELCEIISDRTFRWGEL